jgi:hypothetical protein
LIIAAICANCFGFGLRYAAPMQKRVAPLARAMRAFATTSSMSSSGSDFRPVSKRMLCEQ